MLNNVKNDQLWPVLLIFKVKMHNFLFKYNQGFNTNEGYLDTEKDKKCKFCVICMYFPVICFFFFSNKHDIKND